MEKTKDLLLPVAVNIPVIAVYSEEDDYRKHVKLKGVKTTVSTVQSPTKTITTVEKKTEKKENKDPKLFDNLNDDVDDNYERELQRWYGIYD